MGKRTSYEKRPRDYWPTPRSAIEPLHDFVRGQTFVEPCAGAGDIIKGLGGISECVGAYDIEPDGPGITRYNALHLSWTMMNGADLIITNPPYSWLLLKDMLTWFIELRPTWLLLPSDLSNNKRFQHFMVKCSDMIPVGRVSWLNNGQSGYENSSWYMFDAGWSKPYTRTHRRFDVTL